MSNMGVSSRSVHTLDHSQMMQGLKENVSTKDEGTVSLRKSGKVPSRPKEVREEGQQKLPKDNVHLRRLKNVGAGTLAALRCIGAVGTLGLSELAVRGIRSAYRDSGMQRTAKMSVQLTFPGQGGGTVTLEGSSLPKRIPKGMTQEQLQATLQAKVNRGFETLRDVSSGAKTGPCSQKDMCDIMYFLKAASLKQGEGFSEGAFSITDPGGKIRQFLDSCPQGYQRESSHIGTFQSQEGGRHRGIDVHGMGNDIETCLPDHHKTLLFGSMKKNDDLSMTQDRLYLKMEPYGAHLTSPKGGGDMGGPTRHAGFRDASAILGHTFSFIATRGQGSAEGTRKERIPSDVSKKFKGLNDQTTPANIKEALGKNGPLTTAGGIKVMMANVAHAKTLTTDPDMLKKLTEFESYVNGKYTQIQDRIGNEVMLDHQRMGL